MEFDALHIGTNTLFYRENGGSVSLRNVCVFFPFLHNVMNKGPTIFTSNIASSSKKCRRITNLRIFITFGVTLQSIVINLSAEIVPTAVSFMIRAD
jgi:hypothetical protein